jgi:hypothetical protein
MKYLSENCCEIGNDCNYQWFSSKPNIYTDLEDEDRSCLMFIKIYFVGNVIKTATN